MRIFLIALLAAISYAQTDCSVSGRGGCWSEGFVDNLGTKEQCQRSCQLTPNCNYWHYTPTRGDKRCHFCSSSSDWTGNDCTTGHTCYWGPAHCDGDQVHCPASILINSVNAARDWCTDSNALTADEVLSNAHDLHLILKALDTHMTESGFAVALTTAAEIAASTLAMPCQTFADYRDVDNYGGALIHQLRGLVLLVDDNSERALANLPNHKRLFDTHRIFVADNLWFEETSWRSIQSFFDAVPSHLMHDGVTWDAPFAVMQVKDAYVTRKGDTSAKGLLTFTDRAWNVFQTQASTQIENAFSDTGLTEYGDLLMTVVRHEVSHQFDRVRSRDTGMEARFNKYKSLATKDQDWLRSGVGNDYFQKAPQEIIASQVGNQYFLSGTTQLKLAISRFASQTSVLPIMWFLYFLDLFAASTSATNSNSFLSSVIYDRETSDGITTAYTVPLTRDSSGRIQSFSIPGCPMVSLAYGSNGLVSSMTPSSWNCLPTTTGTAPMCIDTPDWYDGYNDCNAYKLNSPNGVGTGWCANYGSNDYGFGTAVDNCCICGGGSEMFTTNLLLQSYSHAPRMQKKDSSGIVPLSSSLKSRQPRSQKSGVHVVLKRMRRFFSSTLLFLQLF